MRQTFRSFLMNSAAGEPMLIGDLLTRAAEAGVPPVFRVVMAPEETVTEAD